MRLHDELAVELPAAERFHPIQRLLQDPLLQQRLGRDRRSVRELLEAVQVDHRELLAEEVPEASLGQPAHERHLAALEVPTARVALPGLLPLVPLAGRLAVARPGAAPDALALLAGALGGPDVREVHEFTISTRCGIFAAIPRTDGVSGNVRTRPSFSSPSARRIFFCGSGNPMPLRTCLMRMVFFVWADILRSVLQLFGGLSAQ